MVDADVQRFLTARVLAERLNADLAEAVEEQAASVVALRRRHWSITEIAEALSLTASQVQRHAKRGGWESGEGGARPGRPRTLASLAKQAARDVPRLIDARSDRETDAVCKRRPRQSALEFLVDLRDALRADLGPLRIRTSPPARVKKLDEWLKQIETALQHQERLFPSQDDKI